METGILKLNCWDAAYLHYDVYLLPLWYVTPWNRALLEKLTVAQLVKKFYETQKVYEPVTGRYPEPK
jgi:hypothetical protein